MELRTEIFEEVVEILENYENQRVASFDHASIFISIGIMSTQQLKALVHYQGIHRMIIWGIAPKSKFPLYSRILDRYVEELPELTDRLIWDLVHLDKEWRSHIYNCIYARIPRTDKLLHKLYFNQKD